MRTNTAWRTVVALLSTRTCVQPAGGVMVGAPRTVTAATSTSPAATPVGDPAATVVVVPVAVAAPTKVTVPTGGGWVPPPAGVVTVAGGVDWPDTLAAASTAATVYEYVVLAAAVLSVKVVPAAVPTWVPFRNTR